MSKIKNFGLALVGMALVFGITTANANPPRRTNGRRNISRFGLGYKFGNITSGTHPTNRRRTSGYGIRRDRGNHVIRNNYGKVIGQYRQDTIPHDSTYIVPHVNKQYNGSYYVQDDNYYYSPQTGDFGDTHGRQRQAQRVRFGGFTQTEDLSGRLLSALKNLRLDLHRNYSENHGFKKIYDETAHVLESAKYIHDADHQKDRHAIQGKLTQLDKQFHHIQNELRDWKQGRRQEDVGRFGLLSKMDQIQVTIHHLMNDSGVKQSREIHGRTDDGHGRTDAIRDRTREIHRENN
ncbi:hypothetical protein MNBD_PLANCTO02-639 [hydrothermal vent metagenome]|uniref:Uncharacterized protein n=1 Tax=hydrothermal vent metagenome TaxID=652676 RepID=A0A3B1E6Z7_9ZZZZ